MPCGVVIVTHNAAAYIGPCLEAVARQSHPPGQIVVVDNASADDTAAIAERVARTLRMPAEILRLPANVGFAAANNRAVAMLDRSELVALLNPDAFPEPDWLGVLVAEAAAHPEAASFASRLLIAGREGVLDGAGDAYHVSGLAWRHGHARALSDVPEAQAARPVFAACAAAALYRREDWQRAGGFDERFFCYMEDVDLGFRLQLLGRACRYVPGAVVRHVGSASTGVGSPFAVYHGHRNLEWTFVKNMPGRLLWRYLPAHLAVTVVSVAWFLVRGRGISILRAKRDALAGLGRALADRRRIQRLRTTTDGAVLRLMDRSSLLGQFAARVRRP